MLKVEQEYKTNKTPTYSAINKELKRASQQANHIVLHILSDISEDQLKRGIRGRVSFKESIETVTVLKNGTDKMYNRVQILSADFEL